jgi:thymidylate synthase ThyX
MTHRVFSRNASSSRAIPIAKQIDMVESQPVMPVEWGQNKPGMQAGEPLSRAAQTEAEGEWELAMRDAVKHARKLKDLGVHKQIVNRLLEPFAYIKVIVTATEWQNFFDLRISPLAQPEIKKVAECILMAMSNSSPIIRDPLVNPLHAPYITVSELRAMDVHSAMMVSAARCARVSYLNHDGMDPNIDKDLALAKRLLDDKHASCFEHQALANLSRKFVRNFRGWTQHRDILGL